MKSKWQGVWWGESFPPRRANSNNCRYILIIWTQENTCQERSRGPKVKAKWKSIKERAACPTGNSGCTCHHRLDALQWLLKLKALSSCLLGGLQPGLSGSGGHASSDEFYRRNSFEELFPQCVCVGASATRVDAILTHGIFATHHFSNCH